MDNNRISHVLQTWWGKVSEKTSFQLGMELKKVQKQGTHLQNDPGPLSGLQCNALAFPVHFVTHTTK